MRKWTWKFNFFSSLKCVGQEKAVEYNALEVNISGVYMTCGV